MPDAFDHDPDRTTRREAVRPPVTWHPEPVAPYGQMAKAFGVPSWVLAARPAPLAPGTDLDALVGRLLCDVARLTGQSPASVALAYGVAP